MRVRWLQASPATLAAGRGGAVKSAAEGGRGGRTRTGGLARVRPLAATPLFARPRQRPAPQHGGLLIQQSGVFWLACEHRSAVATLALSGRWELNPRPPAPKAGALPNCATPRYVAHAATFGISPQGRTRTSTVGLTGRRSAIELPGDALTGTPMSVSVGLTGFEPAASSSRTRRATNLRHSPSCLHSVSAADTLKYLEERAGFEPADPHRGPSP